MTAKSPKEKAKELFDKFKPFVQSTTNWNEYDEFLERQMTKQCVLIAVDEILKNSVMNYSGSDFSNNEILSDTDYWQEVKKEINEL